MRVLLVEDDKMIGAAVMEALKDAAYAVDWVRDGELAFEATRSETYDIAIVDLGLPVLDGLDLLKRMRAGAGRLPVIVVTARDRVDDRIRGLDLGADDYLVKPFEIGELLARMRAVLRREGSGAQPMLTNGRLALDPSTREAHFEGEQVVLSAREFALLQALLARPGTILSRTEIERHIYGWSEEVESNAVEFLIHAVRKKLGAAAIRNEDRRFWALEDGLRNDVYHGRPVRALLRTRPDGSRFAVTQSTEIRSELAGEMALRTLLPVAALVPCLMLMTAILIGQSLRPLVRLATELDERYADDIQPLVTDGTPSELRPFLGSINGLLGRIRVLMDQQRRFIADAAHELRTPVTALSLQAENLEPMEMPPASRDRLAALQSGMRRTKHLLEQLLALAHQDAATPVGNETVALDAIAKLVVADLLPQAAARRVDLGFGRAEAVSVAGDQFSMMLAVRNLVDNAVKFTPDGGRVDVAVYREGAVAVLQVEDAGPGIPPRDRERLFEPFFRGAQAGGEGAGLGLSIVKRIIDRAQGQITIENIEGQDRSGLRVRVILSVVESVALR